jgi:putative lipoic acid-binding regulatory protein
VVNLDDKQLQIDYPLDWGYKIIGKKDEDMLLAIQEICDGRVYKYNKANKSSKGKFLSFHLQVLVHNDDDRNVLFDNFKNHKNIHFVI